LLHRSRMSLASTRAALPIGLGFIVLLTSCSTSAHMATQVSGGSSRSSVGSPPPPWSYACTTGVGEGCSGPQPITGPLWTDAAGRTISGRFMCGGALTADETATRIVLTFAQQIMAPGAMSCADPILTARLTQPLGTRAVIDATTGASLSIAPRPEPPP
jgi:hypothetical protein